MASTNDETGRFFFIGLLIGVVFSVLAVIQIFTEGGRISLIMLAFWPLVLAGIGGWIDGKRRKSKGKDDQTPTS